MNTSFSTKRLILAARLLLQLPARCAYSRGSRIAQRRSHGKFERCPDLVLLAVVVAALLMPADQASAQVPKVLHNFSARPFGTNSDGAYPAGRLTADSAGGRLYGTANSGGALGRGTVYSLNLDGTGFTTLHNFAYPTGSQPLGGVILSGDTLYGTAWQGGASGSGTIFSLNTDGTGFNTLHHFSAVTGFQPFAKNPDGANPRSGLIVSGSRLYGTAEYGGTGGNGSVFAVNTDGTGFATLHSFAAGAPPSNLGGYTNFGGIRPDGRLVLSGNALYGTATGGGRFSAGTVYRVHTDGTGFTTLHDFQPTPYDPVNDPVGTNSAGVSPSGGLVLSGDTLYGTTKSGGRGGLNGLGTVFSLRTNGTGFTTLHRFDTASKAFYPWGTELLVAEDILYGTTKGSGGTVFALRTDGTEFTNLHSLRYDIEGASPSSPFLLGQSLYVVAAESGSLGQGTLFRLSFAPLAAVEGVRDELIALRDSVSHPGDIRRLNLAIRHLTSATATNVWETESRLSRKLGHRAFGKARLTAQVLCRLIRSETSQLSKPALQAVIDRIFEIQRGLAESAIDEARTAGASGEAFARAERHLERGDEKAAAGKCYRGLYDYGLAWHRARHATLPSTR